MTGKFRLKRIIGFLFLALSLSSCLTEDEQNEIKFKPVTIETSPATSISTNSAVVGGTITAPQERKVTRGICWSTNPTPEVSLSTKTINGTGLGTFSSSITGLAANTTYYVRAYATSTLSTVYGNQVSVKTAMPTMATITTNAVSAITSTTATCGGNITSNGGAIVTARGVCWSTTANPTISNSKTSDGKGTGAFISSLAGLVARTTYYVRAYATNNVGTEYGNQMSFTTAPTTVTDIDGNIYQTVTIGTQIWMVENLKTNRYNDGTSIPLVSDDNAWAALTTPAYCFYNNSGTTYKSIYGALYNWHAVNSGKLAPIGWHVPTDAEWTTLITYLGGESIAGGKLKESGTAHWAEPNTGTNETGFSALPYGFRFDDGTFNGIGVCGFWWSSTQYDTKTAWSRGLWHDSNIMSKGIYSDPKVRGYSVRCIKD